MAFNHHSIPIKHSSQESLDTFLYFPVFQQNKPIKTCQLAFHSIIRTCSLSKHVLSLFNIYKSFLKIPKAPCYAWLQILGCFQKHHNHSQKNENLTLTLTSDQEFFQQIPRGAEMFIKTQSVTSSNPTTHRSSIESNKWSFTPVWGSMVDWGVVWLGLWVRSRLSWHRNHLITITVRRKACNLLLFHTHGVQNSLGCFISFPHPNNKKKMLLFWRHQGKKCRFFLPSPEPLP